MFLGVTGMLTVMSYTDEQRQKIADTVRRTRIDKGLDKEPAARAAKVNSITWKRIEDSEGVRDASLTKVLQSLGLPSADDILDGGDPDPPTVIPTDPEVPVVPTYSEYDALASGIGVVGERLLAMNWHSDAVKAEVAMKLAQLASDIADALFSLFQESPLLRPLYADAFAQSMVASRSFVAAYDQLVEPQQRVGDNFDRSAGLAYGFRPGSSEKEIKDAVDDSPPAGAPGQAGQTQEDSLDEGEAAAASVTSRLKAMKNDGGLHNPDDPRKQRG